MTRTYEPVLHQLRNKRTSVTARVTLDHIGEGTCAAWAGFSEWKPEDGWVQAGIYTHDGKAHVYFEYKRLRYKLVTGRQVQPGETVTVTVARKLGRWVAFIDGVKWMTVPLSLPLPVMFAGVERFADASGRFTVHATP